MVGHVAVVAADVMMVLMLVVVVLSNSIAIVRPEDVRFPNRLHTDVGLSFLLPLLSSPKTTTCVDGAT